MVDNAYLAQIKQIELKKKEIEKEKKEKLNVLVYGSDQLNYPYRSGQSIENEFYKIMFYGISNSESPPFTEFDIVVIHYGVFLVKGSTSFAVYESELTKRKKEMAEFLKKKGTTVCFLIKEIEDDPISMSDKDLVIHTLLNYAIMPYDITVEEVDFKVNRGEFKSFLDKYGVSKYKLEFGADNYKILCSSGNDIFGIALHSKLICLPYHFTDATNAARVKEFTTTLLDCVLSYRSRIYFEAPCWLSDFTFKEELRLREKKKSIEETLEKIDEDLKEFDKYKRILFLGDDELKNEVKDILIEVFGFIVEDNEKFIEDLLIKDAENNPIVLLEVKGLNGNVRRGDISQLDAHRDRNDLPPEFPALLIANTMMKGTTSINDKEIEIHPDQVRHAVDNNIVIIRTLDVLRVLDLVLSKKLEASKFLEIIKTQKGWLKVDKTNIEIISPEKSY